MFRKTLLSAMAVVVLATSVISAAPTATFASDFGHEVAPVAKHKTSKRNKEFAAGAAIGIAAALIGASIFENERREHRQDGFRRNKRERFAEAEFDGGECFEKPVRRYDPRRGKKVVVGFRTVCR